MPHPVVSVLLIALVAFGVVVPLTWWALQRPRDDRANDNVSTAGLRFIGGVFVLIGSFSVVTLWGAQGQFDQRFSTEFAALTMLTDNITLADPAMTDRAYVLLDQYATAVHEDELAQMTSGTFVDPLNGASQRVAAALDGYDALINELAEADPQGTQSLRAELTQLELQYLDRLSWQPPFSPALLIPAVIISLATLVAVALFPAGSAIWAKWLQSLLSAAVIACVLSMIVILLSPQFVAARQDGALTQYLAQMHAKIKG